MPIMSALLVVAAVSVQVKLLEADGYRRGHRGQAARALARERRERGCGGEYALGNRFEPDLKGHVGPYGHADKLEAQILGCGNGSRLGQRVSRLATELAHVKDKRPSGCSVACTGHDSGLRVERMEGRAHSLPAVRGIPKGTMSRTYSARPGSGPIPLRPGARAAGPGP